MSYVRLNADQTRETINTRQRYAGWRAALDRKRSTKGSMVWSRTNGHEYLLRSFYDQSGERRQMSLGRRSVETEKSKDAFDRSRGEAEGTVAGLRAVMARQAAVNRALELGRVPMIGARILRALDASGLLGAGIRVIGTNAMFAYEAAAGVHVDAGLTTTEDIDLLFDSRARLSFIVDEDVRDASLLKVLQRADLSFERTKQSFRAVNRDGYLVDLVKPLRDPPWRADPSSLGADPDDLAAVEIAGLQWLESAEAFEATVIDQRGEPLRMVTADPRVFAAHKLWMSKRVDRDPLKRHRDAEQARVTAVLVADLLLHLPYLAAEMHILPRPVFDDAAHLFTGRSL